MVYSDPKVNPTMFHSILLNGVTSFACESHGVKRAKPIFVFAIILKYLFLIILKYLFLNSNN